MQDTVYYQRSLAVSGTLVSESGGPVFLEGGSVEINRTPDGETFSFFCSAFEQ